MKTKEGVLTCVIAPSKVCLCAESVMLKDIVKR